MTDLNLDFRVLITRGYTNIPCSAAATYRTQILLPRVTRGGEMTRLAELCALKH